MFNGRLRRVLAAAGIISIVFLLFTIDHTSYLRGFRSERKKPSWSLQEKKSRPHNVTYHRPGVLIHTNYRSGSSFFGELFNQHPNVFYSYEPLILQELGYAFQQIEILNSTFNCNISDASEAKDENKSLAATLRQCRRQNVCFRNRMKNLCSYEFCTQPHSCMGCLRMNSKILSELCESKSLTAAKVIRLQSLQLLRPLLEDDKSDIKVIHLVRDPRGIYSSRMKLSHKSLNMKTTCDKILQNAKLGLINAPEWLRSRYKLIRYEDLALSPMEIAEEIYDFVGLEMTATIRQWITINTLGHTSQSSDPTAQRLWSIRRNRRRKIPTARFENIILSNAYTTIRHSNSTWRAWTNLLDSKTIEEIQDDCKEVMELLGYRIVKNGQLAKDVPVLNPPPFSNKDLLVPYQVAM